MKPQYKILLFIIFIAALIFLVSNEVNPSELVKDTTEFPTINLIILLFISLLISLLKSWRFFLLLKNTNIKISFWENFKIFIAGQSTSPLPGGETLRGFLLHHEGGITAFKTSGPIITQAIIEIVAAAIVTLIGSLFLKQFVMPAIILMIILLLISYLLLNKKVFNRFILLFPKKGRVNKILNKLSLVRDNISRSISDSDSGYPNNTLIKSLAIAITTNILGGLLIMVIAISFKSNLGLFKSIFAYSSNIVIQGLTTPGGIGFAEGGMVGILLLYKLSFSKALAIVVIYRLVTLIFNIVIGLIFLMIFYHQEVLFTKKYEKANR